MYKNITIYIYVPVDITVFNFFFSLNVLTWNQTELFFIELSLAVDRSIQDLDMH